MGKTLGILGGMGPMATMETFRKIIVSTDAHCDQEHLDIVIYNKPSIPDRTNYILTGEDNPTNDLIESAKKLEDMGAEYLIMPCNTAHYFYEDIVKEINIPFLNMVEESGKYIKEHLPFIKKVGLLSTKGTYKAKVYDNIFRKYNIEVITPDDMGKEVLLDLIYNIKRGEFSDRLDSFYQVVEELKKNGSQLNVLACTELSLLYEYFNLGRDFLDTLEVLCFKAVEYSGKQVKRKGL